MIKSFPFCLAINLSRTCREAGPGNDESIPSISLETRTDAAIGYSNKPLPPDRPSAGFTTRRAISSMAVEPSNTSDESLAPYPQQPTRPEMRPAAEVFGFLLEKRRSSGPMPTSAVLPVTRGVNLPVNHTRTAPASAMNSEESPSPVEQLAVTAAASRASRIPRSRRSLPLPDDFTTLNFETQLLTTSSTEPASTPNPTYDNYDILRSATNTTERAHVATSHLTSASERDVTSAPAPKRSAHRRSASCGPTVLIPNNRSALPDTTGAARPKGLKSDDSKENTNSVSTAKKVALCTSSPSSFDAEASHTHLPRFFWETEVPPPSHPFS